MTRNQIVGDGAMGELRMIAPVPMLRGELCQLTVRAVEARCDVDPGRGKTIHGHVM